MPFHGSIVVIKRSGNDGSAFPLVSEECLIGRAEGCDIRVQLEIVSEEHCRIEITQNAEARLVCLSEKVGRTQINRKPIKTGASQMLYHKSIITVGDRDFRWEYPDHSKHFQQQPEPATAAKTKDTARVAAKSSVEADVTAVLASANVAYAPHGSTSAKTSTKRRVSFGPYVAPEIIDNTLPPSKPVKKGAAPLNLSLHTNASGALNTSSAILSGRPKRGDTPASLSKRNLKKKISQNPANESTLRTVKPGVLKRKPNDISIIKDNSGHRASLRRLDAIVAKTPDAIIKVQKKGPKDSAAPITKNSPKQVLESTSGSPKKKALPVTKSRTRATRPPPKGAKSSNAIVTKSKTVSKGDLTKPSTSRRRSSAIKNVPQPPKLKLNKSLKPIKSKPPMKLASYESKRSVRKPAVTGSATTVPTPKGTKRRASDTKGSPQPKRAKLDKSSESRKSKATVKTASHKSKSVIKKAAITGENGLTGLYWTPTPKGAKRKASNIGGAVQPKKPKLDKSPSSREPKTAVESASHKLKSVNEKPASFESAAAPALKGSKRRTSDIGGTPQPKKLKLDKSTEARKAKSAVKPASNKSKSPVKKPPVVGSAAAATAKGSKRKATDIKGAIRAKKRKLEKSPSCRKSKISVKSASYKSKSTIKKPSPAAKASHTRASSIKDAPKLKNQKLDKSSESKKSKTPVKSVAHKSKPVIRKPPPSASEAASIPKDSKRKAGNIKSSSKLKDLKLDKSTKSKKSKTPVKSGPYKSKSGSKKPARGRSAVSPTPKGAKRGASDIKGTPRSKSLKLEKSSKPRTSRTLVKPALYKTKAANKKPAVCGAAAASTPKDSKRRTSPPKGTSKSKNECRIA